MQCTNGGSCSQNNFVINRFPRQQQVLTLNSVFLPEKSRRGKRAEKMRTQLKVAAASGGGGSAVPDWWLGPNWGLLLLCRRSSTTIAQLSDQLEVTCVV